MFTPEQMKNLELLRDQLLASDHSGEKLLVLCAFEDVRTRLQEICNRYFPTKNLTSIQLNVIAAICAIRQEKRLFPHTELQNTLPSAMYDAFIDRLLEIDKFYDHLGGIVGYHLTVLQLVNAKCTQNDENTETHYNKPEGIDIAEDGLIIRQAVLQGIAALPQIAEIYPIGGAGDRLNLHSEEDNTALPAAKLQFCGRTLLCGLIRDLHAREYLHYKLYDKQVITPIALMTSQEKDNHKHICGIAEENAWYGRPISSFLLFSQPLVPVITKEGHWVLSGPLTLLLKPGGHGVLWKQAKEEGVLDKLYEKNRYKILIRQINNPMAGIDNGLLAFVGEGMAHNYSFGFMSCPRLLNASEGVLVFSETKNEEGTYDYRISNIEYTEFKSRGITDTPTHQGHLYSAFPANTNILFGDLEAIKRAMADCPIPGLLINMKSKYPTMDEQGNQTEVEGGRLESTMQNISDWIVDNFSSPISHKAFRELSTFVVYNERRKTIAPTKSSYVPGKSVTDTPEGAFYTLMQNGHELLKEFCHFQIPSLNSIEDYLNKGPSLLFLYHPALGPLYSIIAQKIQGGVLAYDAELQLEIADLHIEYLHLKGSLLIKADAVMGHTDDKGLLNFSDKTGKCVLKNITIENKGIDREATSSYWKNKIERYEALEIYLEGHSEFYAENVIFKGAHSLKVPDGHRMIVSQVAGELQFKLEKIQKPGWHWIYSVNDNAFIRLTKRSENEE